MTARANRLFLLHCWGRKLAIIYPAAAASGRKRGYKPVPSIRPKLLHRRQSGAIKTKPNYESICDVHLFTFYFSKKKKKREPTFTGNSDKCTWASRRVINRSRDSSACVETVLEHGVKKKNSSVVLLY